MTRPDVVLAYSAQDPNVLASAVQAVLALHRNIDGVCETCVDPETDNPEPHPCPTRRAITDAGVEVITLPETLAQAVMDKGAELSESTNPKEQHDD